MNLQEKFDLIELAKKVATLGGNTALDYFRISGLVINNKGIGSFDPVTKADISSEDRMRKYIKKVRPFDSIIGEEKGILNGSNNFKWVLDPIDGTRAFISGIPVWTVLVALLENDSPVLGVVYQPFTGELFVGGFGASDYYRGGSSNRISVRSCSSLSQAYLASTFPEIGTELEKKAFDSVVSKVHLCRYGLDGYAYALLAAGYLDIVVEAGLKIYDVAATIALIEAAGGIVTNWSGGPAIEGGQILACGDKLIHKTALDILSK